MADHGKILIALVVSLLALTLAAAQQCGSQAGGQLCPNNLCCSKFGFCGSTPPYCGEDCQSQCSGGRDLDAYGIRPGNEQCGSQAGGQLCPNNLCCSKFGFCGSTPPYCGEDCQSQCSGGRDLDAYGIRPGNEQCGSQAGGQLCPNNLCCSKFGFCGSTPPYCGEDCQSQCSGGRDLDAYGIRPGNEQCGSQAGGQLCPNNLCCSKFGFCGSTPPYCGEDCQSQCSGGRDLDAYGIRPGNEQCGSQAGGQLCPNNLCCSKFGFCGSTPPYCGEDCQSQCSGGRDLDAYGIRPGNEQCGSQAGGQLCPNNLCCSKFGFCGSTPPYCGEDCQSQCSGGLRATIGNASYYSKYVPSTCYGNSVSHFPPNRYMAAVNGGNPDLWKNGQGCGKHYRIRCEGKGCRNGDAITIQVVDRCHNGCHGRIFDLSEEAFGAIADKDAGVIKVEYAPIERDDAIPWAQKKLIAEVGRIRK